MAFKDQGLRGRPVVVAEQTARGRVMEVSPEARSEGVEVAMAVAQAKRCCRSLLMVPPDFLLYRQGQERVFSVLQRFTPLVEPAGWGNYYLDLTGTRLLWGMSVDAAVKVRDEVTGATNLFPRIGLAANKLVSSVAGNLSRPRDVCSVIPGEEKGFLAPLHLHYLPRLGAVTRDVLTEELGIQTIGSLAAVPSALLTRAFGSEGTDLARLAQGEDREAVMPPQQIPSLQFSHSFAEGENRQAGLQAALFGLCEQAGRALRKRNRVPHNITVAITYVDGVNKTGAVRAGDADDDLDARLFDRAGSLLDRMVKRRVRVRDLTFGAVDLRIPLPQLSLFSWDTDQDKARALMGAIDRIRVRFGSDAVVVGRRFGIKCLK